MSTVTYAFDPPPGEERSESWLNDLYRCSPDQAREVLHVPAIENATKRRAYSLRARPEIPTSC